MLETAVLRRDRPVKAARHPLRRVITRPRPGTDSSHELWLAVSACQPAVRHQGFTRCPLRGLHGKDARSCGRRTGGLHMLQRVQAIASPSWVASIGLTIAVAITYFLAARLSLALLTEPDGVAVFWPAAGIASGIMIALGPVARLPVAVGVMAATVTANLLGDRNIASAIVFALCNAGEAMIIAWLIEHHFGSGLQPR